MDLISSVLGVVAAALISFGGHFVAHDLYKEAPRYAKRLLDRAVGLLPEADRRRYEEEWFAHLQECVGVFGKFRHAVECLIVANKLRRIVEGREQSSPDGVEFLFSSTVGTAKVWTNVTTALPVVAVIAMARDGKLSKDAVELPNEVKDLLQDPDVDFERIREIHSAMTSNMASKDFDLAVQFVDRFGRQISFEVVKQWLSEQGE